MIKKKSKSVVQSVITTEKFAENGEVETTIVSKNELTLIAGGSLGDYQAVANYTDSTTPEFLVIQDAARPAVGVAPTGASATPAIQQSIRRSVLKVSKEGKLSQNLIVENTDAQDISAFISEIEEVAAFVFADCFNFINQQ
jgi:gamma-glutamylcysteine synthetase